MPHSEQKLCNEWNKMAIREREKNLHTSTGKEWKSKQSTKQPTANQTKEEGYMCIALVYLSHNDIVHQTEQQ